MNLFQNSIDQTMVSSPPPSHPHSVARSASRTPGGTRRIKWIGKSVGLQFQFEITQLPFNNDTYKTIEVFTTRPDTLFGASFVAIAADHPLAKELEKLKISLGVSADTELTTENLKTLVTRYKALIKKRTRSVFPQDVMQQL